MPVLWAGVVRVSFVGTRAADRFHADQEQIDDIQRAAAGMGVEVEILKPELDVSGGLPLEQRPSLLAAVEGVEQGDYAGIIVSYLSRLGRSVREQLRAWDRVEACGGRIVVVREGIDTSTASGRMHRTILLAIAENEREQHVERFAERRQLATAAGIWQRRQTPLGYQRDPRTRRLKPDDKAGDVQQAFHDRAVGIPVSDIARRLGMTTSGVRALLRNRVYLGELKVGPNVNPTAHPALVAVDEFEAAQAPVARPGRRAQRDDVALLGGLVRCQGCGHMMSRGSRAYMCHARSSAGPCPAPAGITMRLLDQHVERIALLELQAGRVNATEAERHIVDARARLADAERELAAFLQAVSADTIGAEAFGAAARARSERVEAARVDLRRRMSVRPLLPNLGETHDVWEQLSVHERNQLLRALLEVVVVRKAGRGGRPKVQDRVRVIRHGAGLVQPYGGGGVARGIEPVVWVEADDERVAGVFVGEDALEAPGG